MSSYLDEIPDGIRLNATTFESVTQNGVIDGSGERFRNKYQFDVNDENAYEQAWVDYPNAWDVYLGTVGETFSDHAFNGVTEVEGEELSNPQVLLQAINFYIYTTGEDPLFAEAQEEQLETQSTVDGVPLSDSGRLQSFDKYVRDEGSGVGTYENPNAFYDSEVYDNVVSSDGFLPRVTMNGEQTLSTKYDGDVVLDVLTTEEKNRTEYENVLNGPDSAYGWGSPYATGGKLAREV